MMYKPYPAGGITGPLAGGKSNKTSAPVVPGSANFNQRKRVNSQTSIYSINHHDFNNTNLCQQLKSNDNNHLHVVSKNKNSKNTNVAHNHMPNNKNINEKNNNALRGGNEDEINGRRKDNDNENDDDDNDDDEVEGCENNENENDVEDDDDDDEDNEYNLNNLETNQHSTRNESSINSNSNANSTPIRTFTFFRFALIKYLINQRISRNILTILTPVAASFSVAIVIAAIAGPLWLITEEKIPKIYSRPFANFSRSDGYFDTTYTKSSLWNLCVKQGGNPSYNCLDIDYFTNEIYSPDPNNSTNVIPYAIKHSTPFFIVSALILLISYFLFLMAMCSNSNHHKMYYFFSGVIFIISGLIMLIGLIVYISIFKAEIRYKLRPRSMLQEPLFTFNYGQSFKLFIIGLMITELSGILNVLLYTSLYQQTAYNSTNSNSKKKTIYYTAKFPKGQSYTINEPIDYSCSNGNIPNHHNHHQVYYCDLPQSPMMNNAKRYYLKKDYDNLNSNSLNELYLETNLPSHHNQQQQYQQQQQHQQQQQQKRLHPALSRSVSTTTDFFQNFTNEGNNGKNNDDASVARGGTNGDNDKDLCNMGQNNLLHDHSTLIDTDTNNNVNKEKLFGEFCKKAGPRPRPKNIYYVQDDTNDDENNIFIIDSQSNVQRHQQQQPPQHHRQYQSQHFNYPNTLEIPKFQQNQLNQSLRDVNFHLSDDERHKQRRSDNPNSNYYGYSRTLPRNFMKRKYDINDNLTNRRISAGGLYAPFSAGYHHQYHHNTSFDNLLINDRIFDNHNIPQWPKVITKSPSIYSNHSYLGVIPSAGGGSGGAGSAAITNYHQTNNNKRYHHFNEFLMNEQQKIPATFFNDISSFDLDQIERERRKSHSSLFESTLLSSNSNLINEYDYKNGTPV